MAAVAVVLIGLDERPSPPTAAAGPLRRPRDRAPLAGAVGAGGRPGRSRTPASRDSIPTCPRATCSRCCPTRRASRTSATSRTTRWATRSPTTAAAAACGCCTRWATTRSGCRPRTTRSTPASIRRVSTDTSIEEFRRQFRSWGVSIDWRREFGTHEPRVLPLDAVDLPEAVRARARVPQARAGQVVPAGPDRARQRAGDRRRVRALRHAGRRARCSSSGSSRSPTTPTGCWRTSSCWSPGRSA